MAEVIIFSLDARSSMIRDIGEFVKDYRNRDARKLAHLIIIVLLGEVQLH